MDDDPYDLMADAMQEAADDYHRQRVEEEHGEEIRESVDRRELLALMSRQHSAEWPKVERELAKAEERLKDGEYEEAIFHAGRAFDGYIGSVCIDPIRTQMIAKFERLLPDVSDDDVLKQVNGMVGGAIFTSFAISTATEDQTSAEDLLRRFRDFIGTRDKYGVWQLRNPIFHTTDTTDAGRAKSFLSHVNDLLADISAPLRAIAEERERQRTAEYFSPAHIFVLQTLAPIFEQDKDASLGSFEWPKPSGCTIGEVQAALYGMWGDGFVERTHGGLDEHWKLTPKGYGHWKRDIQPQLDGRDQSP